jgi:glutathione synthase/RimK-type ligase-like ATP-grasp enzyme
VWFRRGAISNHSMAEYMNFSQLGDTKSIKKYFNNEANTINEYIVHVLRKKKSINNPNCYNANKLIALDIAKEVGLHTPNTIIARNAETVNAYLGPEKIITKSVQDAITVKYEQYRFSPYVYKGFLREFNLPSKFYYSKFQSLINGKYEVRIFFVGNEYYAGAQFICVGHSQEQHRKKDTQRVIPYRLPDDIITKLKAFNRQLGYNSGSIDMVVDNNDIHYFLEINPVGQYDFLSNQCNYNLDLEMYKYFTDESAI